MPQKVNDSYPEKSMSDNELKEAAIKNHQKSESTEVQAYDFPTEIVELPSKGKLYPSDSPLSKGTIEMKYMTAKEEDILTNQSFIKNGVVLDKLFQALIVSPIDYNELLLCDKNAIMIAARVLGYGKDYVCNVMNPNTGEEQEVTVDLTQLGEKEIDWNLITPGVNKFDLELPASKRQVTISCLSQSVQKKIEAELKGLAKLKRNANLTTMLKHVIVAIDGETDNAKVRKFVDKDLLAIDSRAIRQHLKSITPDINLTVEVPDEETGDTFPVTIVIGLDFFWPDHKL